MPLWIQSVLRCMCSSSFLFLLICQYDIFLVWFDFSVFGSVHNLLQVFVKVTEQDTAFWRSEKNSTWYYYHHIQVIQLKQKKFAAMADFQFVNANQLRANIVNTLAWYSIAVLSRLYQVLQHTPSNLSGTLIKQFWFLLWNCYV